MQHWGTSTVCSVPWGQAPYFGKHWQKVIESLDWSMERVLLFLLTACPHDPGIDAARSIAYIYHGHKTTSKAQN